MYMEYKYEDLWYICLNMLLNECIWILLVKIVMFVYMYLYENLMNIIIKVRFYRVNFKRINILKVKVKI